ncbi:hypothetical protein DQ02_01475 [Citrobacter amalonaticus]|nr:hypothetical protein DQ02_01475 [Citrobacter amalonaticus]RSC56841.1 hypothetical protein EGW07_03955 [Citrobacter amalonaticus]
MLLFIAWVFSFFASEMLLWQISSANIIVPIMYFTTGVMYLYQKNKIKKLLWLDKNIMTFKLLNLRITFSLALVMLLSFVVYINFITNSLVLMQWLNK